MGKIGQNFEQPKSEDPIHDDVVALFNEAADIPLHVNKGKKRSLNDELPNSEEDYRASANLPK